VKARPHRPDTIALPRSRTKVPCEALPVDPNVDAQQRARELGPAREDARRALLEALEPRAAAQHLIELLGRQRVLAVLRRSILRER